MANGEQDSAEFHTGLFNFKLGGKDALSIFLFIVILALMGLTIWEHQVRSAEHDIISCQIKLSLYMQTQVPEKPINWRAMPTDLYGCVPRMLFDRDVNNR